MSIPPAARIGTILTLACLAGVRPVAGQSDSFASPGRGALSHYQMEGQGTRRFTLPPGLAEISGIGFTRGGSLLAHGDEVAVLWRIDPAAGPTSEKFGFGNRGHLLHGDFEDIQVVGERIFLVTSAGQIFEGREAPGGSISDAIMRSAGLGGACEVEGMAWDAQTSSLLLLCKRVRTKQWRGSVVVLALSIESWKYEPKPRMLIKERELERVTDTKGFSGTAIVRHPRTGSYLLLAGPQRAVAEVTAAGEVISGARLPSKLHRQPEGIAIASDLTLFLSDEAAGSHATLTAYAFRP